MRCLVVGYGSAGKRHVNILKTLGCDVVVVTAQSITDFISFATIPAVLRVRSIDYIVIASATHLHYEQLKETIACDFRGVVLIEKPLFAQPDVLPPHACTIFVAYNLRFHPLLMHAKAWLSQQQLCTLSAEVGQYLPTWRHPTDYRDSYSAKKEMGGGVLRDLSHELDYVLWLGGACQRVAALGGKVSALEIDSDDSYFILMQCIACPLVQVQMNYLNRKPVRRITANTYDHTLSVDLMEGTLLIDDKEVMRVTEGIAQTYWHQHDSILQKNYKNFCTYDEGYRVVKLIAEVEQASATQQWVTL